MNVCFVGVALICDSETGTWYKFNDENVEKIDAKKLKFAIEDDSDGESRYCFLVAYSRNVSNIIFAYGFTETSSSKKNKVPKAPPKGSYHSINAYMLVYTRATAKDETANVETACRSTEWKLPPSLEEFVALQNEQFESWVSEIKQINVS